MIEIKDTPNGKDFFYYSYSEKQRAEEKLTRNIILNIVLNQYLQ